MGVFYYHNKLGDLDMSWRSQHIGSLLLDASLCSRRVPTELRQKERTRQKSGFLLVSLAITQKKNLQFGPSAVFLACCGKNKPECQFLLSLDKLGTEEVESVSCVHCKLE